MEDHIPIRPDISLFGRQTSKWSLWDVVFHDHHQIKRMFCLLKLILI